MRCDSQQIRKEHTKTDIAKMRACDGSATITWMTLSIDKVVHFWVDLWSISCCCGTSSSRCLNILPSTIMIAGVLDHLWMQSDICDMFLCSLFCALSSQSFFLIVRETRLCQENCSCFNIQAPAHMASPLPPSTECSWNSVLHN